MHAFAALSRQLTFISKHFEFRFNRLENLIMDQAAALAALQAAVAAEDTVIASAIVLINGIADRITAAGTDADALAALTADIQTKSAALAAAVEANQPAAPADPVDPAAPTA